MAGEYTITLSDGVTSFTIYPLEQNGPNNQSTPRTIQETNLTGGAGFNYFKLLDDLLYRFTAGFTFTVQDSAGGLNDGTYTVAGNAITGVNTGGAGTASFEVAADVTSIFTTGEQFTVTGSTANDGTYTVTSSSYSTFTTINVAEAITDGTVDGTIGSATFSGTTIKIRVTASIPDNSVPYGSIYYSVPSSEIISSLLFPGRGSLNYGEGLTGNMVHMLEHFAHTTAPSNPVAGQLWYKTSEESLYVRDSTNSFWFDITLQTLGDLTDVTITSVGDNEVLAYDTTSSMWINQTAAEAGLSAVGHTHTSADITDFNEAAQDAVGLAINAGTQSGITVVYNDSTNSIDFTVASPYMFQPVRAATVTVLPFSPIAVGSGVGKTLQGSTTGSGSALTNVDGVSPSVGDRLLVKDQATASDNGIYELSQQAADNTYEISLFNFLQGAGGQVFIHTINVLSGADPSYDQTYIRFDGHTYNGLLDGYYIRFTYNGSGYAGSTPSDCLLIGGVDVATTDTAAQIATKIYNVFAAFTGTNQYFQSRSQPTSTQVTITQNRRGNTWTGGSNNVGTTSVLLVSITQDQLGINADYEGKYVTCSTPTNSYYYYFTSAQFNPPNDPAPGGYLATSHTKVQTEFMEDETSYVGVTNTEIAQAFKAQIGADVTYFSASGAAEQITITNVTGGAAADATDGTAIPMVQVSTVQQGGGATPYILTRTSDFDGSVANSIIPGLVFSVTEGTVNGDSVFMLTTDTNPIVIDTTALAFADIKLQPLDTITDVTITSVADNEVLAYDNGTSTWINQTAAEAGLATASHTHAINDLSDVVVTAVTDNEVLAYDNGSGNWINQTAAEAGLAAASHTHTSTEITDFTEAAQDATGSAINAGSQSGITVTYNDSTNSIDFTVTPGASTLGDLTDVTITSVTDNEVLAYNTGTSTWINQTAAEAGLATASHTHTSTDITDFTEAAQDAIGSAIGAGTQTGIAVTYNDGSNSIDFDAAPDYQEFSATASQTVFNTTPSTVANGSGKSFLQVFVNGVYQQQGASKAYTVTGANQITFNSGLTAGDDVVLYSFSL